MFKFLTEGWAKFATGKMQFEDPNKNQLGKGTSQRFLESNFKELDDYTIDQLENLIERVLDPTTCNVEYLKHFESLLGITMFPAFLVNDIRRKVITHAIFYYKKKLSSDKPHGHQRPALRCVALLASSPHAHSSVPPVQHLDRSLPTLGFG